MTLAFRGVMNVKLNTTTSLRFFDILVAQRPRFGATSITDGVQRLQHEIVPLRDKSVDTVALSKDVSTKLHETIQMLQGAVAEKKRQDVSHAIREYAAADLRIYMSEVRNGYRPVFTFETNKFVDLAVRAAASVPGGLKTLDHQRLIENVAIDAYNLLLSHLSADRLSDPATFWTRLIELMIYANEVVRENVPSDYQAVASAHILRLQAESSIAYTSLCVKNSGLMLVGIALSAARIGGFCRLYLPGHSMQLFD